MVFIARFLLCCSMMMVTQLAINQGSIRGSALCRKCCQPQSPFSAQTPGSSMWVKTHETYMFWLFLSDTHRYNKKQITLISFPLPLYTHRMPLLQLSALLSFPSKIVYLNKQENWLSTACWRLSPEEYIFKCQKTALISIACQQQ